MPDPPPARRRPPSRGSPAPPDRGRSARTLVLGGVVLALVGIIGLAVADMYAPTAANVTSRARVLSPESHAVLQATSFLAVLMGILLVYVAAVRRRRRLEDGSGSPAPDPRPRRNERRRP